MTERSIIFNSEMVRAILEGRKIQTRMPVNPQPERYTGPGSCGSDFAWKNGCAFLISAKSPKGIEKLCPYGRPGDRLYVKEMFAKRHDGKLLYAADFKNGDIPARLHWRSEHKAPKWSSRITLEITNVRVERVAGIDQASCYLEGLPHDAKESHPTLWFKNVWNSVYGKGPFAWGNNPWVWVIEFKRI